MLSIAVLLVNAPAFTNASSSFSQKARRDQVKPVVDRGGHRAASIHSLVETARLNGVKPEAWLINIISRIADHLACRVAELLPSNYRLA